VAAERARELEAQRAREAEAAAAAAAAAEAVEAELAAATAALEASFAVALPAPAPVPVPVAAVAAPQGQTATALYAYDASGDDELSFAEGEVLTGVTAIDEGWWRGYNAAGLYGMFPAPYVQAADAAPAAADPSALAAPVRPDRCSHSPFVGAHPRHNYHVCL
jgi:hypothetical protein